MNLFPSTLRSLENGLTAASLKQRVISMNIANADTANYKSKQVDFAEELKLAMQDSSHQFQPKVTVNESTSFNINGNNVDMDTEMAQLAKNQLWYEAMVERVNGQFNNLKIVIDGR